MKNFESKSLRVRDGQLSLIDQTLLPKKEVWINIETVEIMEDAIIQLKVRGAPLIGVAAVLFLQLQKDQGVNSIELNKMAERLKVARPTAVNLALCIDRFINGESAEDILIEDVKMCSDIGKFGDSLVQKGDGLLTHCNSGELATAGIGTAVGVLTTAHKNGKKIHVFVDETRPLLQGGRLTAWEMEQAQIPYTLICDNMAAAIMRSGRVQGIFVGADRIATNGDFANKVGTYSLAILAKHHHVPFYVCAPYTTVDVNTQHGDHIEIEMRNASEVRGVSGSFGKVEWAPANCPVFNPAFDVTPHELVTGWILNTGIYKQSDIKAGALKNLEATI